MNKKTQENIRNSFLFLLVTFGLGLFLYSLYHRIPHLDDAWIGEQVYWLNKDGVIKNVLMKNYANNEHHLLAYHKAFVYNGLASVKLFGFSLFTLKSVSLAYLLIFFGIFYYYLVRLKKLINSKQFLFAVVVLLLEPHIFEYAFVFRPEIMLMVTGFISFVFFEQSFKRKRNTTLFIFLAAVFSGISLLTHLNGFIFILAGAIILLFNKQIKYLFFFGSINLLFVYFYFNHLESVSELLGWFSMLTSYNSGKSDLGFQFSTLLNVVLKFLSEHQRFFHSPKEIALSLLLITSLLLGWKTIKRRSPLVLPYSLILVIGLALISPTKTSKYLIPIIPFFSIMIIIVMKELFTKFNHSNIVSRVNRKAITLITVFVVFLTVSFIYDGQLSQKKFTSNKYYEITQQFVKKPLGETTILAPMTFVFDQVSDYKEIIGLMSFNERSKTELNVLSTHFFTIANNERIDYIVINNHYIDKFNLGDLSLEENTGSYKLLGEIDGLSILENNFTNNDIE